MNSAEWQSEGVPPGDLGSGDLPPGDLGADELALRTLASGELPSPLLAERALAAEVAAGLERLIGLFRWLSPPAGYRSPRRPRWPPWSAAAPGG